MRKNPVLAFCLGLLAVAPLSSAQTIKKEVHLSYAVIIDQSPAEIVEVSLRPSARKDVKLKAGYVLSFARSGDTSSVVSALKSTDGRVLHKRQGQIDSSQKLKVAYLICGGQVTHISPAPDKMPKCQA